MDNNVVLSLSYPPRSIMWSAEFILSLSHRHTNKRTHTHYYHQQHPFGVYFLEGRVTQTSMNLQACAWLDGWDRSHYFMQQWICRSPWLCIIMSGKDKPLPLTGSGHPHGLGVFPMPPFPYFIPHMLGGISPPALPALPVSGYSTPSPASEYLFLFCGLAFNRFFFFYLFTSQLASWVLISFLHQTIALTADIYLLSNDLKN